MYNYVIPMLTRVLNEYGTANVMFSYSAKLMYQSNRSLNINPPPLPRRAYPGHLMSFPAREGGNLNNLVFPGVGHLITAHRGWGI